LSLPAFKLLRPRTSDEAIGFLAEHAPDIQVIAGGTDLVPSLRQGLFAPAFVLDIRGIAELRGIRTVPGNGVEIGALTSLTAIEHSEVIRRQYPVLSEAARTVASPVLRNMGTIGGNICLDTRCLWYNQSLMWRKSCGFCIKKDGNLCHVAPGGSFCWAAFSGDTPPALLCLDAEVEIAGAGGRRRQPLRDFYTNAGDARMKLEKNELLTRVFLPETSAGWSGVYRKMRIRGSIDYPLAGVAVALKTRNGHAGSMPGIEDARVAITAVNPAPLLVPGAKAALIGRPVGEVEDAAIAVGELAARTAKPLTTSALTPEYRREMIRVFTRRAVLSAMLATDY
jgi:4-hydroxybenzoyl-CoA reductase subunit beta